MSWLKVSVSTVSERQSQTGKMTYRYSGINPDHFQTCGIELKIEVEPIVIHKLDGSLSSSLVSVSGSKTKTQVRASSQSHLA